MILLLIGALSFGGIVGCIVGVAYAMWAQRGNFGP